MFIKKFRTSTLLLLCSFLVLFSCSKTYRTIIVEERQPLPDSVKVYNFSAGDNIYGSYDVLGSLKVNTKSSYSCNMIKFRNESANIARKHGGNALILKEVDLNYNSNIRDVCYSFESDIVYLDFFKDSVLFSESVLKEEWQNRFDPLEGIYESTGPMMRNLTLGVRKNEQAGYSIHYLKGASGVYSELWNEGSLKAELTATGSPNNFKAIWYDDKRSFDEDYLILFQGGFMNIIHKDGKISQSFIKTYPTENTLTTSSGTGFAISKEGYIATNNHVVEGANTVVVKGIDGDFTKEYEARVIITDEKNDLAIIKIEDLSNQLQDIPYSLNNDLSNVGEDVFVLGYPLRATMGDEIKLTSGLISSRTGYQGDVTLYQVSAPTQPGNSGGPMIDNSGNIVGIVSAKHAGAENVTYAIKTRYLLNLFELLPEQTDFTYSSSNSLNFSDRISMISNFTYIIERK
ncbi:MAG: trypsin-like peptidase domain-containing protein [Balneolaceae bacterium]|nr:trypsin-like peptidase domain-containing protein [Balneolaceae bacterium]MBO6546567.1 trypsin-like peptidase domain-containing protein [Balneolaceae bacterium]MBO6648926.1 trypsin-like peptidase domain-containing protein [Balneolaceae bacterium]